MASIYRQVAVFLKRLAIPAGESVHAVIALGYPDEKEIYQRLPGRKALRQRAWDPDGSD